jgi:uncharacterized RDD family membrane protein YckC
MERPGGRLDIALERETRVAAFLIDFAIRVAIVGLAAGVFAALGNMGMGFWLILAFLVEWLYPVAFELGRAGATPGKAAMGLRVVMDSGLPVTPGASLARNLLRAADFMPAFYGLGLVCMLTRADFRRVGDIAAGTLVVHRAPLPARASLPQVQPRPPAIAIGQREQAVLIALAARAPTLTGERLHELAALAAPVTGEKTGAGLALTDKVLGVAQWLLGRRP